MKGLLERFVNLLCKRSRLAIDEGARAIRRITIHKRADIGLDEVALRQLCGRVLKVRPDRNIGPMAGQALAVCFGSIGRSGQPGIGKLGGCGARPRCSRHILQPAFRITGGIA
ncbi:hypothetical protein D3C80_1608080 [compost metagenome]